MSALFSFGARTFTWEGYEGRIDDCFVGLSFPQDPTTHFQRKFILTRPATTFGLVKATRLTASLGYERELFIEN